MIDRRIFLKQSLFGAPAILGEARGFLDPVGWLAPGKLFDAGDRSEGVFDRSLLANPRFKLCFGGQELQTTDLLPRLELRGLADGIRRFRVRGSPHVSGITVTGDHLWGTVYGPEGKMYLLKGYRNRAGITPLTPPAGGFKCSWSPRSTAIEPAVQSPPPRRRAMNPSAPFVVRLFFIFDNETMAMKNGADATVAFLKHWVDDCNTAAGASSQNGHSPVRFEFASATMTSYSPTKVPKDDLAWLVTDGTSGPTSVLWRNSGADLVTLVTWDGGDLASPVLKPEDFKLQNAFAIVSAISYAAYTLQHETCGHNLGMQHNVENDLYIELGFEEKFPWAHGKYVSAGDDWTRKFNTIMGEGHDGGWPQVIPYYSNLNLKFHGVPMGDEQANNAKQLGVGAAFVSQYHTFLQ